MGGLLGSFLFLFGLCVGSFINCLVYRLHSSAVEESLPVVPPARWANALLGGGTASVLTGRSFCPHCKHQLAWHDNIPLLSFVLLRGRCRYCQKPISIHYPLVELATGILTVSILFHLRGVPSGHLAGVLVYLLITYALIAIFVSDLLYFTVPDEIVLPAIGLSVLFHLANSSTSEECIRTPSEVSPWLAGLAAAGFFLLLVILTRGRGMGLGDVKLAALMGFFLGYPQIIVALYIAFLTGAIFGVILILLKKKKFGEHIPFGPFLVSSTIVTLFYGEQIKNFAFVILHF